jgi:hypothetical protein
MIKIIIVIIIVFIIYILNQNIISKKEFFDSEKEFQIDFKLNQNKTFHRILNIYKQLDYSISENNKKNINSIFDLKNNKKKNKQIDSLLNLILITFISNNSGEKRITKEKLKKLFYYFFGEYALIDTMKENYKKNTNGYSSIQIPINILSRIDWMLFDKIFEQFNNEKGINYKDILEIKKNILLQQFLNNQIPLTRSPYIYDNTLEKYGKKYINIMGNNKSNNYGTINKGKNYKTYNFNLTTNTLIQLYNGLNAKKKKGNIVYKQFYKNYDTVFNIIAGNLYLPSEKHFEEILVKLQKEIKKQKIIEKKLPLPNLWNDSNKNYYLSDILNYPLRSQLPINNNCQRVWYNCHDEDRINNNYNYYGYNQNPDYYIKTSTGSQIFFSPMQKKK